MTETVTLHGWAAVAAVLVLCVLLCLPVWIGSLLVRDWLLDRLKRRYEDRLDAALVAERMAEDTGKRCTLEEIEAELGLDQEVDDEPHAFCVTAQQYEDIRRPLAELVAAWNDYVPEPETEQYFTPWFTRAKNALAGLDQPEYPEPT